MQVNMKVIGTANVLSNISLWERVKFKEKIRKALNVTRLKVENSARNMAPVDTGALKASIWSEMVGDEEAQVGDGVYYGIFNELGTKNNEPHPFIIPAFEANRKELEKQLKEMVK